MLDLSLSMPIRDNFLPAKKVAMALHSLISSQFPRDYLGIVGFSETARILTRRAAARGVAGTSCTAPTCSTASLLARQLLARQTGTKQIIMITDGEPTAHIEPSGDVFFNYPPVPETVEATLREVLRCTRDRIRINTFMLDANCYLKPFVERLTAMNRGRAFFTTPETLGDYVLVDFIAGPQLAGVVRRGEHRTAAELDHVDGPGEAAQLDVALRRGLDALGQALDLHRGQQHLERAGGVAQAGGHVDGRADVVVALEQQGVAGGHADAQLQRSAHLGRAVLELEREGDARLLLDRDDHAAVAQPLGDAHAALAGDLAGERAERAEQPPGRVVAERRRVVREPARGRRRRTFGVPASTSTLPRGLRT